MKKHLTIFIALTYFSSCSSIHMKYETDVTNKTQQKFGQYKFEKSYDVGAIPGLCGLTAIFFGGACWYYLVMPTTGQQTQVEQDGLSELKNTMGADEFEVRESKVEKVGWGSLDQKSTLNYKSSNSRTEVTEGQH